MYKLTKLLSPFILLSLILFFCKKDQPAHHLVPQWHKQAVWYQIFPERFRNGDRSNDPKIEDIIGAYPFDNDRTIQTVPWTSDWYELQPWEQDGKGFYYHVHRRRYGGDLRGVLDRLDYLQELGINAIYFNPLFESPSLHKYDATYYHHIDDNFGPDPAGDKMIFSTEVHDDPLTWQWTSADTLFLKLIKACHQRQIRVIIDGVFNHVGRNFFAFGDLRKNQQQSKYKNWFSVKSWDNPNTEEDEFDYECWFGVKNLPEIREDSKGFDKDAWTYLAACVKRWMDPDGDGDPSDGIDGWRLDAAEKVTNISWIKFRKLARSINPEAYLVGEVWWEQWPQKMFNAAPWLQGDMFDAVMNYRFAAAVTKFFIDQQKRIAPTQFNNELAQIRLDYPTDVNYVLQNLLDSHDNDRLASMIVNPDRNYGANNRVSDNQSYEVRKPGINEIKIQKLLVLFQMTYLGAPMIYYGDEAGMWGASDPDDRKPMLWSDLQYDDEASHPLGLARPQDKNKFNHDLFNYYKELIKIRKEYIALQLGDFQTIITDDQRFIYAFERNYLNEKAIVVFNNSDQNQSLELALDDKYWIDLLSGNSFMAIDGKIELKINSKSGLILIPGLETRLADDTLILSHLLNLFIDKKRKFLYIAL